MPMLTINENTLSIEIENRLVKHNLRHMQQVQKALIPGYYLRAAQRLKNCDGTVLIGTGFPVGDTFETDGPVGAIALYNTLEYLGVKPILVCSEPLYSVLKAHYRLVEIPVGAQCLTVADAKKILRELNPQVVVSIEAPGVSANGNYYNMRLQDITARAGCFDHFITQANCPTIAIGDGGNEIGMGNVLNALTSLDIIPSVTACDELLVADISNWGAYGLIAFLALWKQEDLLSYVDPLDILKFLSNAGSVDGITLANTLTEDGLGVNEGLNLIDDIRALSGFISHTKTV